jgi:hypothetical protein
MSTPTPDPTTLDDDLQMLAMKRAFDKRTKRLLLEEQQYHLHRMYSDSPRVLPDCQYVNYLPGPDGGQS